MSWWYNREYCSQDAGYTEDFVTQHAIEFMRDNKDRPFFCYVPFHIVHAPLRTRRRWLECARFVMQFAATLSNGQPR